MWRNATSSLLTRASSLVDVWTFACGQPQQRLFSRLRYNRSVFGGSDRGSKPFTWGSSRPLLVATVVTCGTVYIYSSESVAGTSRRHNIFLPVQAEETLGQIARKEALPKGAVLLHDDSTAVRRVKRIVGKLEEQVHMLPNVPAHRRSISWRVSVVDNGVVNAAALPGGQIVVFSGLLKLLSHDDELASVLGHEMAHVLCRHAAESVTIQLLLMVPLVAFEVITGISSNWLANVSALVVNLPNSRAHEKEADSVGMALAARSCFNPEGMVSMLKKLGSQEKRAGVKTPEFLSTHPLTEDRVRHAESQVLDCRRLMELSNCDQRKAALVWGLAFPPQDDSLEYGR